MAHVVIITSGIASLYNPAFALAHRLSAVGHRVTYASAANIGAAVVAQGLPFVQLHAEVPHSQREQGGTDGKLRKLLTWPARWLTVSARREQALAALGTDDFVATMRALAPDLCLIDVELSTCVMSALALNIPVATITAYFLLRQAPGVPPLHQAIVPGHGWRGSHFGIKMAWLRYRLWKRMFYALQWARAAGADPISVLRLHARRIRFDFDRGVDLDQWLIPFIFRDIPLLYANPQELDLPHPLHPTTRYLGPLILHSRDDSYATDAQAAVALLRQLAAQNQAGSARKLIYCAFGAFFQGDDTAFFRRVIAAVAQHPEWNVIIGLGGRGDPAAFGVLPDNVHLFTWVPQLRALEVADCAVIHGGSSSFRECVQFGVPMLVYPFKRTNDQLGVSARVTYHRLGIVADRDTDDAAQIASSIERLLLDDTFRRSVAAMRGQFQHYADGQHAITVINDLLRQPEHGS